MKHCHIFRIMLMILACTILISSCSRLTQENFDKIQTGMSMTQVIALLGEPTTSESVNIAGISGTSATWKNKNVVITIQFLNSQVQIKTFSRTEGTQTDDTQSPDSH